MITDVKFPLKIEHLEKIIKSQFKNHSAEDLFFSTYTHQDKKIAVFGIHYLIDTNKLESSLLAPLLEYQEPWSAEAVLEGLPFENGSITSSVEDIFENLILGTVFIYIEDEKEIVMYPLLQEEKRSLEKSENESVIIGPQIAFTESLSTNLKLIRHLLPTTDLVMEKLIVGNVLPTEVRIVYMKSVANEADVNTMRQRIQALEVDELEGSTSLKQYIEDATLSLFPQFYLTELPTHLSYTVKEGKIGVLVENSPDAFIAPSTFFSFFETTEDFYMRWLQGSTLRILRMFAVTIAIMLTPLYVAIVTYQYELIPTALIVSIGKSRASVPFPPIVEALLLELLLELIREAGARLPTKIGQTMGIVGGIVIGQAAVQAGITSNVLIIVVAMSALASFTTPSYLIGTSFRIIRFPLIALAGFYGLIGLMFGISFILIHLLRTKSLGRPYFSPIYPLRIQDFNKVFFRPMPQRNSKRASMYRPTDAHRYSKEDALKKRDIEE